MTRLKSFSPLIPIILLGCLIVTGTTDLCFGEDAKKDIRFRWAFGALVGSKRNPKLITLTKKTALNSGDQIKMYLEVKKKCFVYVVYRSADGQVYMLFPYTQSSGGIESQSRYYIPQGKLWFELDENTGFEKFHLLASADRLKDLETIYDRYKTATSSKDKAELEKQIFDQIKFLKNRHHKLTATAERPMRISGALRSIEEESTQSQNPYDIKGIAKDISFSTFYSKTYTIDHK